MDKQKKHRARILIDGKQKYLGSFDSPEEAADAVAKHKREHNIPPKKRGRKLATDTQRAAKRTKGAIFINGKTIYLGMFDDKDAAQIAIDKYRTEHNLPTPRRGRPKKSN